MPHTTLACDSVSQSCPATTCDSGHIVHHNASLAYDNQLQFQSQNERFYPTSSHSEVAWQNSRVTHLSIASINVQVNTNGVAPHTPPNPVIVWQISEWHVQMRVEVGRIYFSTLKFYVWAFTHTQPFLLCHKLYMIFITLKYQKR